MKGSTNNTSEEQCGLCFKAIVENRDEALFCKGSCNKWMHRYCVGVSLSHYEALQYSPLPFLVQTKHSATIEALKFQLQLSGEKLGSFMRPQNVLLWTLLWLNIQAKLSATLRNLNGRTWSNEFANGLLEAATIRATELVANDDTSSLSGPSRNSYPSSSLQKISRKRC